MDNINLIIKKGEEKLKEFQEIENLLSYPEIIADTMYYKHLLTKQAKISNIAKLTKIVIDQIGQLKELQSDNIVTDAELKSIVEEEVFNIKQQINANANILQLMMLGNSQDEIIVEILFNTKNEKIAQKLQQIIEIQCKKLNFNLEIVNFEINNKIKLELKICGKGALELFESEIGIHRIIHNDETVTAELIAYPYCDKQEFKFNENEIKIETFRSSGAGGQHINRTNSAVRITHIPTGISSICQNQRSQIQNKNQALKVLISKLSNYFNKLYSENVLNLKNKSKQQLSNKIKEYNFNNNLLTDIKNNKTYNLQKVCDGEINFFINY